MYGGSDQPVDEAMTEHDTPTPPATGDTAIDEAMTELAKAEAGSFAERIEAGERAHRMLQGRLDDLGGT